MLVFLRWFPSPRPVRLYEPTDQLTRAPVASPFPHRSATRRCLLISLTCLQLHSAPFLVLRHQPQKDTQVHRTIQPIADPQDTMPSRTLPFFTRTDVEAHSSAKSCYVTVGDNVYDVTDFLDAHPGGSDLVLDWAGKDITAILKDPDSHDHSEAAYEVLEDSLVGFVAGDKSRSGANGSNGVNGDAHSNGNANGNGAANGQWVHPRTGMSTEEDLNKETDYSEDYKKHKFLDLNKPLFPQVWFGGFSKEFYLDQVHRPRHYKGGQSAPFFGNFLEPLSKTPWWVVPLIWWPCVAFGVYSAAQGFEHTYNLPPFLVLGFFIWSLIEYLLHRFLFHLD